MPNGTLHRFKRTAEQVVRDLRADGWNARVRRATSSEARATGKSWVAVLGKRKGR